MASTNYLRLFLFSWRMIALGTLIGAILALGFSFAQPLRYSSTERVLITQTNTAGIDPYTAIKSTERIAQNLVEIIYTSSFFNAVMSNSQVDPAYFPTDEIAKRKKWRETIETNVSAGTGVMSILAYHTNRDQATELAVKVAEQLSQVAPNYFGFSVRVQIIDDPLPSRFFAKPDFLRNTLFGAVIGFLFAAAWVFGRVKSNG
ncbi:hypothetical protein KBC59_01470 [Patescibacteria group bacterium]|nr:hypothetical protein [Patescibacteria group bacterium]